jgi:hypothetical protein
VSNSLSVQDIVVAKSQCLDMVTRLFKYYDLRDYDKLFTLFTPDGVWNRPDGAARVGPELLAALAKRPANLTVSHVLSNLLADVDAADRITVTGLMTIFRDDNGKLSPPPAKMSPPTALIEFIIQCRKIGQDWRAAVIDINYIFKS